MGYRTGMTTETNAASSNIAMSEIRGLTADEINAISGGIANLRGDASAAFPAAIVAFRFRNRKVHPRKEDSQPSKREADLRLRSAARILEATSFVSAQRHE